MKVSTLQMFVFCPVFSLAIALNSALFRCQAQSSGCAFLHELESFIKRTESDDSVYSSSHCAAITEHMCDDVVVKESYESPVDSTDKKKDHCDQFKRFHRFSTLSTKSAKPGGRLYELI